MQKYGSAKTTTGAWEIIRHILDTPNGFTLIGCHTVPQLEKTAQKEFFEMFPQELIESWHKQQRELIIINGHTVIFRPLDDEGKIRSLNLTAFWINISVQIKPIENGETPKWTIPCQVQ
jgi:phage terminase large subunit